MPSEFEMVSVVVSLNFVALTTFLNTDGISSSDFKRSVRSLTTVFVVITFDSLDCSVSDINDFE